MEIIEQGRASKQIVLYWSEQSGDNQSIEYLMDQREVRILDWIG